MVGAGGSAGGSIYRKGITPRGAKKKRIKIKLTTEAKTKTGCEVQKTKEGGCKCH